MILKEYQPKSTALKKAAPALQFTPANPRGKRSVHSNYQLNERKDREVSQEGGHFGSDNCLAMGMKYTSNCRQSGDRGLIPIEKRD